MQHLPSREELDAIMVQVFSELGLSKASVYYAGAELEELVRDEVARPTNDIAINLRLEITDGHGGLRLIRLRLDPENNTSVESREQWIKQAFKSRLRFLLAKS